MDSFLLDTTVLSMYLDPLHKQHALKRQVLEQLPRSGAQYVSSVALAELGFGAKLASAIGKQSMPKLEAMIEQAKNYAIIDVTRHTSAVYADLKARVACRYLAKLLRRDRPGHVEEWVDRATGKKLEIDENDLWMCSQAKERDLVFVTADRRMLRIRDADPSVRMLVV